MIGNYKYKTDIQRSNIGEFDALIKRYQIFINKENDTVFSLLIKAQKLDFETKNDTIFAYGNLEVKKEKEKTFIVTKENYVNGYENYTDTDSIIRTYEQFERGKVKFNEVIYYRGGVIKKKYVY